MTVAQFLYQQSRYDALRQRPLFEGGPPYAKEKTQLPPIGVGRPFADLVAFLDEAAEQKREEAKSLARLNVEVRTSAGAPSDSLRLASWFTREPQPVDADRVLSDSKRVKPSMTSKYIIGKRPKSYINSCLSCLTRI